jgi:hypothetical protein
VICWCSFPSYETYPPHSSFDEQTSTAVEAPQDYYDRIHFLNHLLKESQSNLGQVKELVAQIKELELEDPSLARLADDGMGTALKAALAEAKAASEVHGPSSIQAIEAWDKLDSCFGDENGVLKVSEECDIVSTSTYRYSAAALKAHHNYDAAIDTTLLQESLDAVGVLEALGRFVSLEKRRLDARDSAAGP